MPIASIVNGVPTEIDVKKLENAFGVPKPGQEISYDAVSATIGHPRKTHRWRTVTEAWRNQLWREHDLVLSAIPNKAFRVLESRDRVHWVGQRQERAKRQLRKGAQVAITTDRTGLTAEQCRPLDHAQTVWGTMKLALDTAPKQLDFDAVDGK